MNLYEMTESAKELYNMLSDGEIDEQTVRDTLEGMEADKKLESYVYVIKSLEADEAALKTERDRITRKVDIAKANVERLKRAVIAFLVAAGQTKARAGTFDLSLGSAERVSLSEDFADESYLVAKYTVDKQALKRDLKDGKTVKGASLVSAPYVKMR